MIQSLILLSLALVIACESRAPRHRSMAQSPSNLRLSWLEVMKNKKYYKVSWNSNLSYGFKEHRFKYLGESHDAISSQLGPVVKLEFGLSPCLPAGFPKSEIVIEEHDGLYFEPATMVAEDCKATIHLKTQYLKSSSPFKLNERRNQQF